MHHTKLELTCYIMFVESVQKLKYESGCLQFWMDFYRFPSN